MINSAVTYIAILILMSTTITACGIKPAKLDPPPGSEQEKFPRDYPDASTDDSPYPYGY